MAWGIQIILAWLLADLLTGIIHWAQDILLVKPSRFKFLNKIKTDNDLHHFRPAAMLKESYWGNINTSAPYAWTAALTLLLLGCPPLLYLTLFFGGFTNIVHRLAHYPKSKLNIIIQFLQWIGLFQSVAHHKAHHYDSIGVIQKENTTQKYCVMTDWLNPILDRIHFFQTLEKIISRKV